MLLCFEKTFEKKLGISHKVLKNILLDYVDYLFFYKQVKLMSVAMEKISIFILYFSFYFRVAAVKSAGLKNYQNFSQALPFFT